MTVIGRVHRLAMGAFACLLCILCLVGCGQSPYSAVSGTVTFKGKPVPSGEIRLTPDSSQGNKGPMISMLIVDGKYQTPEDKGVIGGPYQVRIMGYGPGSSSDPTAGEVQLFDTQQQTADFPKGEDTVHDITIGE